MNETLSLIISTRVQCHHDARRQLGSESGRTPSDHSPISLHISSNLKAEVATRKQVRYNLARLGARLPLYQARITVSLTKWYQWRLALMSIPGGAPANSPEVTAALFYAGLIFAVSLSAHEVLGVTTTYVPLHSARPMLTHRMPDAPSAMWAYVAKQKRAQQARDADPFPLQDTLQHMMAVYTCSAPPGTPHTRAQVARSEALLDALPPHADAPPGASRPPHPHQH